MSSLVCEVLSSAGKLAKDDWNTKITKLNSRALEIKRDFNDFIERSYGEFLLLQSTAEKVDEKLSQVKLDAENLQNSLESMATQQLQDANSEFQQLSLQHAKTSALVFALEKLYSVHTFLDTYDSSLKKQQFCETSTAIKEIKDILNSVKHDSLGDTEIYKTLCVEVTVRQENLIYVLTEVWDKCIVWNLPATFNDDKTDGFSTKLSLDFSNQKEKLSAQDIVFAMQSCKALGLRTQKLANMFLNNILIPLIKNPNVQPETQALPHCNVICIKQHGAVVLPTNESNESKQKFSPEGVFNKVWEVLRFLNDNFLKLKIQTDKDETLMSLFAPVICEDTITLLVDECLEKSVPDSKEQLEAYDQIVEVVAKFESALQSIHFLPENPGGLLAYVSDIHVHFANRRCTAIMGKARSIMKKEIHETSPITDGGKGDVDSFFSRIMGEIKKESSDQIVVPAAPAASQPKENAQDVLLFPKCRVSTSTLELVSLVYETLYEAMTASSECAMRLIVTIDEIFEHFQSDVPNFHRDALESLPQVSAVHHNNCYYIAHHLLTMGQQLSTRLPSMVKSADLTFVQQVQPLRKLGEDCFLAQMRRQRNVIVEYLSPLKNFATNTNADKYQMAEKPIKQVMYQLHHLRKVWRGVLPLPMFMRSLSALVDSAIGEVVNSVCSMEDITSDDSVQLKTICCILRDQLPALFAKPEDEDDDSVPANFPFQRSLRKWPRLIELVFVLDASLRDIVDRWADGKGPLGASFTVVEAKGLIRALFQNTDRRADAISKIRY